MKSKTALVFPGQGSQAVGMGKDLYDNFSTAREVFKTVDDILSVNLSQIMFEGPSEELLKTQNAQPALMAVSMAIITVLEKEFGVKVEDICSLVAGHSLGEYSALCAAKAITLEQAAKLLQERGLAMAKCGEKTQGAMAAILGLEIDAVEEVAKAASDAENICQVANDNSVGQVVISGSKDAVVRALDIAKEKGAKRAILLPVSGAFHSNLMSDARKKMTIALEEAEIKKPIVPIVANITAEIAFDPLEIKKLLIEQVTGSVRWRETMLFMQSMAIEEVVEIGSGKVLSGLVGRTCPNLKSKSVQNVEDLKLFASLYENNTKIC